MMRHLLVVIVIAMLAVAASWVLVPGGEELALMHLKDRRFGEARHRYEQALDKRGLDKNIVAPLLELQVADGEIDQAIALAERYLHSYPNDLALLELLLDYYRQGQRMDAYRQTLARLCQLAPSTERLGELAFQYRLSQRPDRERATLQQLLESGAGTAAQGLRLADLQVSQGDLGEAVRTLDELWLEKPAAFDRTALQRSMQLRLELRQPEPALALAQAWLRINPGADAALDIARLFANYQAPLAALAMLRNLPLAEQQRADVFGLAARLRIEIGEAGALLTQLLDRERVDVLTDAQRVVLVETALHQGRHRIATERAKSLALAALPEWTLVPLVESALAVGQRERAVTLFDAIPAGVLAANPLLAAQLSLSLGRAATALMWTQTGERSASDAQRVALAQLYLQLDRPEDSLRVLQTVDPVSLEATQAAALARLYVALEAPGYGLDALQRAGITHGEVWALLATAAGAEQRVLDWLTAPHGDPPGEPALAEIQALAAARGVARLADVAAERGYRDYAGVAWRIRLAERRVLQQDYEQAKALLTDIEREDTPSDDWYRRALFAAQRAGADVRKALTGLARETLMQEGEQSQAVRTLAYDLLAIGAMAAALPLLEPLGTRQPAQWLDAYVDALVATGQRERAIETLVQRLDALMAHGPVLQQRQTAEPGTLSVAKPSAGRRESRRSLAMSVLADAQAGGAVAGALAKLMPLLAVADAKQREAEIWAALDRLDDLGAHWSAIDARRRLALAEPVDRLDWFYAYIAAASAMLADEAPSAIDTAGRSAVVVQDKVRNRRQPATAVAGAQPGPQPMADGGRTVSRDVQEASIHQTIQILLDRPGRSPVYSEALVLALREHIGAERALPQLRVLAARGGAIERIYRDTLRSLGLRKALVVHLRERARAASAKQARALADELLSLGEKTAAIDIYQSAAIGAAPDSQAIEQLLYLWGPRPDDRAMRWLLERMQASPKATQSAWAERILELGGADRLARVMRDKMLHQRGDEGLTLIYLRAVAHSATKAELAAQIEALIGTTSAPENLRSIAKLSEERDLPQLAVLAYTRLLAKLPNDPRALKFRGLNAYDTGRYQEAELFLKRYHAIGGGDFETHYFYAEALTAQGYTARAAPVFSKVIALIERMPRLNHRMRSVLAKSQHRLGRVIAARGSYERLLAERPAARDLRADYADLLHEERSMIRSGSLLGRP